MTVHIFVFFVVVVAVVVVFVVHLFSLGFFVTYYLLLA